MIWIFRILYQIISWYGTFMLIYCLAGWFIRDRSNGIYAFFAKIAEPPLYPIRKFLSRFEYFRNSPVDFSPLILFFILRAVVEILARVAILLT